MPRAHEKQTDFRPPVGPNECLQVDIGQKVTGKAEYHRPQLTVYGSVGDMTRTVGTRGRRDARRSRRRTGY